MKFVTIGLEEACKMVEKKEKAKGRLPKELYKPIRGEDEWHKLPWLAGKRLIG